MKGSNYFKEMKGSIEMIYQCAPRYTIFKIVSKAVLAVMIPLQLFVIQNVINAVTGALGGEDKRAAWLWCGIFLFCDIVQILFTHFNNICQFKLNEAANRKITYAIVKKFCSVEYFYLEDREMNDTINLMGREPDVKLVERFENVINVISYAITLIGSTLFLVQVSWGLMIGFGLMLILTVFYNYKGMDMMNDVIIEQTLDERRLQYISDVLSDKSMLYELKIYKGIGYMVQKWKREAKRIFSQRLKVILRAQRYFILTTILFILWAVVTAVVFAKMLFAHQISFGLFTSFLLSVSSIMDSTELFSNELSALGRKNIEINHYHKFMNLPDTKEGHKKLQDDVFHIEFRNISFTYPSTNHQVLKNVSFRFDSGESVALVGENGAGKSTLVKLLLGLYQPDGGAIYVNQQKLSELNRDTMRKLFSVIFQDYTRYYLTLRENVAFGNMKLLKDDEKILQALRDGMAEEVLELGKKGLETNLGKIEDGGIDLSGGQWQRVALSRALISDASFVILDEPTAAMDPIAESKMYESFFEVMRERGSIMISHRLASARMADKIIVLSDGQVCETGNHKELMERQGLYYEMYMQQSAWYQSEV